MGDILQTKFSSSFSWQVVLHIKKQKPKIEEVSSVRDARAVMHVGIANPQWRRKRCRLSQRMRNPQFCVSGKKPMGALSTGFLRADFPSQVAVMRSSDGIFCVSLNKL